MVASISLSEPQDGGRAWAKVIAIAAAVFGASMIAFGLGDAYLWMALVVVAFMGWGMVTTFAGGNTVLQTLAEEDKRVAA